MKKKYLALLTALMLTAGISTGVQAAELKALNTQQANIVTVAAFMAKGDLPNLKKSLATALDNGMTVNQAKEVLVHLYAYTGFPRSLNALSTLNNPTWCRNAKPQALTTKWARTPLRSTLPLTALPKAPKSRPPSAAAL